MSNRSSSASRLVGVVALAIGIFYLWSDLA